MVRTLVGKLIALVAALGALIIGVYAVNALSAVLVWLLGFGALVFITWAFLGRLWDAARHGKPILRGGFSLPFSRSSDSSSQSFSEETGKMENVIIVDGTDRIDPSNYDSPRENSVAEAHRILRDRD